MCKVHLVLSRLLQRRWSRDFSCIDPTCGESIIVPDITIYVSSSSCKYLFSGLILCLLLLIIFISKQERIRPKREELHELLYTRNSKIWDCWTIWTLGWKTNQTSRDIRTLLLGARSIVPPKKNRFNFYMISLQIPSEFILFLPLQSHSLCRLWYRRFCT